MQYFTVATDIDVINFGCRDKKYKFLTGPVTENYQPRSKQVSVSYQGMLKAAKGDELTPSFMHSQSSR